MASKDSDSEDCILSELVYSSPFKCEICDKTLESKKTYEIHVSGRKHKKKLNDLKLRRKENVSTKDENENEDSDEPGFSCEVCNISCTDYRSLKTHLAGNGHAKKVKKEKLKEKFVDRTDIIICEKKGDETDSDLYARCIPCKKEFLCPESLNQHAASSTHLKKVKHAEALKKTQKEKGETSGDETSGYRTCETCGKSFTGLLPYQIHLQSKVHIKTEEKIKCAKDLREYYIKNDNVFICKECKKCFTDIFAFKLHLENNSHEKDRSKRALSDFLENYPEIVYAAVEDEKSSDEATDDDESDPSYYLICKICHVTFSGQENAKEHVMSKKHIANKKEKKLRKSVEQIKLSSKTSATSDGESSGIKISKEISQDEKAINDSKNDHKNNGEFEII